MQRRVAIPFGMKTVTLLISILVGVHGVISQTIPEENFLLKRFESNVSFDRLQEFSTSFDSYVEKMNSRGKTKLAVRICSSLPLKMSVKKSVVDLSRIFNVFEGYGFDGEDVLVLRSDECVSGLNRVWPTELWVINNEDKLPPYKEKLYSNEVFSEVSAAVQNKGDNCESVSLKLDMVRNASDKRSTADSKGRVILIERNTTVTRKAQSVSRRLTVVRKYLELIMCRPALL